MNAVRRTALDYSQNVKARFNNIKPILEYCGIGFGGGATGIGLTLTICKMMLNNHANMTGLAAKVNGGAFVASAAITLVSIYAGLFLLALHTAMGIPLPKIIFTPPQRQPGAQS